MTKQLLKTSALSLPSGYHFHPCLTETPDSMDIAAGRSCVFPLPQITTSEPPRFPHLSSGGGAEPVVGLHKQPCCYMDVKECTLGALELACTCTCLHAHRGIETNTSRTSLASLNFLTCVELVMRRIHHSWKCGKQLPGRKLTGPHTP